MADTEKRPIDLLIEKAKRDGPVTLPIEEVIKFAEFVEDDPEVLRILREQLDANSMSDKDIERGQSRLANIARTYLFEGPGQYLTDHYVEDSSKAFKLQFPLMAAFSLIYAKVRGVAMSVRDESALKLVQHDHTVTFEK